MRVLVLGEYRADRLVPELTLAGAEVTVLGFQDLTGFLDPKVRCGTLPANATVESLRALLAEYEADVAIPNVSSPGQEQLLTVYARLGAELCECGPRVLVHSPEFATLACDKVALHQYAVRRGWPVPNGVVCDSPAALVSAPDRLGLPVLVKEARSESFAGRHFVSTATELTALADRLRFPVLVQQAIHGEEYAVELLTLPAGTAVWPVAGLGTLDRDCAPGLRARVQPAILPTRASSALATVVQDIVTAFQPMGPWQIDFALDRAGQLNLIEINGRFSGVSNMSWISTSTDPHRAHAQAVLHGRLPRPPRALRVALEVPVPNGVRLPEPPQGTTLTAFTANPGYPGPYTSGAHRAVLSLIPARAEATRAWLRGLPPGALLVAVESVVEMLDRGHAALGAIDRTGTEVGDQLACPAGDDGGDPMDQLRAVYEGSTWRRFAEPPGGGDGVQVDRS